jgi:hypothetical protein
LLAEEEGFEPRPYSAEWQIFTVGFRLYSPDDALIVFEGFCNIRDEDNTLLGLNQSAYLFFSVPWNIC